MTNYNESQITGSKWTRCNTVHINNQYGTTPTIIFGEEEVVDIGETYPVIRKTSSEVHASFDAQNGVIPLRNPTTNELTGESISHIELYTILYSLYIDKALLRDNAYPTTI